MARSLSLIFASMLLTACSGSTTETNSTPPGPDAGAEGSAGASGSGGAAGSAGNAGAGGAAGAAGSAGSAGSAGGDDGGAGAGGGGGAGGAGGGGGDAGASGGGGAGGAAGGTAQPECQQDADCELVNDCCTCAGVPSGTQPPTCDVGECFAPVCAGKGIKAAQCVAGRCVAGFSCDDSQVQCKMPIPTCPTGQVPEVKGDCYTGSCVSAEQCATVTDCAACTGGLSCAVYGTMTGPISHCVTIPSACGGDASCACLGPSVCSSPYTLCSDLSGPKGISCGCPTC